MPEKDGLHVTFLGVLSSSIDTIYLSILPITIQRNATVRQGISLISIAIAIVLTSPL